VTELRITAMWAPSGQIVPEKSPVIWITLIVLDFRRFAGGTPAPQTRWLWVNGRWRRRHLLNGRWYVDR
jgi:hypothetical protein